MIGIVATIKVQDGKNAEFEKVFLDMAAKVKANEPGCLLYQLTRTVRDLTPEAGDGGGDLLATNVDVKCSVMRAGPDPLRYRLLVRPKERLPDAVYLLALVAPDVWTTGTVTLVGWCRDNDLPVAPAAEGPFAGAFVRPATTLNPLPPVTFNWWWHYGEVTCRPPGFTKTISTR